MTPLQQDLHTIESLIAEQKKGPLPPRGQRALCFYPPKGARVCPKKILIQSLANARNPCIIQAWIAITQSPTPSATGRRNEMTTNRKNIESFNAAFDAGTVQRVVAEFYPSINSQRAVFYKNTDNDNGWVVYSTGSGDVVRRISADIVARANKIEKDSYNDAAYAREVLNLAIEVCSAK